MVESVTDYAVVKDPEGCVVARMPGRSGSSATLRRRSS
jgi:hypothetical protein